eukprot:g3782.t1
MGGCTSSSGKDYSAPKTQLTLLLLGLKGAGKSSLVRNICSNNNVVPSQEESLRLLGVLRRELARDFSNVISFGIETRKFTEPIDLKVLQDCASTLKSLEWESTEPASKNDSNSISKPQTSLEERLSKVRSVCKKVKGLTKEAFGELCDYISICPPSKLGKYFHKNMQKEHLPYWWKEVQNVYRSSYKLSIEKILKIRESSERGAYTTSFDYNFDGNQRYRVNLIDVGGQLRERKFWVEQCSEANAILYINSLESYDHYSPNKDVNDFLYSFRVLSLLLQEHKQVARLPLIVLLNKYDLFKAKLKISSVSKHIRQIPDFCDEHLPLTMKFMMKNVTGHGIGPKKKRWVTSYPDEITACVTCAMDQSLVKRVFQNVIAHVRTRSLQKSGFGDVISVHDLNLYTFDERVGEEEDYDDAEHV